jgi:hypothetical protein
MEKWQHCTWKINSNYPQDSRRLVTLHARWVWIPRVHEVKENTLVIELLHIVTCDCLLFISESLKHSRLHFSPLTTPRDLFLGNSLPPSSLIELNFPSPPFTTLRFFHFTSLKKKKFRTLSVQPGLRGSNDLHVGRKMATFQLFFLSGLAKDLSAPLYHFLAAADGTVFLFSPHNR